MTPTITHHGDFCEVSLRPDWTLSGLSPTGRYLLAWTPSRPGGQTAWLALVDVEETRAVTSIAFTGRITCAHFLSEETALVVVEVGGVVHLQLVAIPDGGVLARRELEAATPGLQLSRDRHVALVASATTMQNDRRRTAPRWHLISTHDLSTMSEFGLRHFLARPLDEGAQAHLEPRLSPDGNEIAIAVGHRPDASSSFEWQPVVTYEAQHDRVETWSAPFDGWRMVWRGPYALAGTHRVSLDQATQFVFLRRGDAEATTWSPPAGLFPRAMGLFRKHLDDGRLLLADPYEPVALCLYDPELGVMTAPSPWDALDGWLPQRPPRAPPRRLVPLADARLLVASVVDAKRFVVGLATLEGEALSDALTVTGSFDRFKRFDTGVAGVVGVQLGEERVLLRRVG